METPHRGQNQPLHREAGLRDQLVEGLSPKRLRERRSHVLRQFHVSMDAPECRSLLVHLVATFWTKHVLVASASSDYCGPNHHELGAYLN